MAVMRVPEVVTSFLDRAPEARSITSMGFAEGADKDGFTFVRRL